MTLNNVPTKVIAQSTYSVEIINAYKESIYNSATTHSLIYHFWVMSDSKISLPEFKRQWFYQLNNNSN